MHLFPYHHTLRFLPFKHELTGLHSAALESTRIYCRNALKMKDVLPGGLGIFVAFNQPISRGITAV